ncbi:hypothetical protein CONPUDRAFT_83804 [Coniophora puteana RWD-64-598 SS2]|uniref:Uncharacterized protein n=1 Tax=Coniophora puteana (strain RWD-64-598) TaxID=741705 RepID=A0A5M3MGY8_CONPW|nr:uncharacterized protein CONPUDRAFT_83804 [Coniophora puteana RWD-64-598 SS2]EIW78373.1 hypothetical protein CONPUDRAFT_83804 [Coniophora puteana RWD-64-598 SS2]
MYSHPLAYKRARRTATNVLAGDFDPRPTRDVLTSVLNIGSYASEKDEEARRLRREEKKKEKEKRREKVAADKAPETDSATSGAPLPQAPQNTTMPAPPPRQSQPHSFWRSSNTSRAPSDRPTIQIATLQRPRSVTPPPMPSSPQSTPGPSSPGGTSRTSSKRPHTPDDDEDLNSSFMASLLPRQRKKRYAARKGWKGWVEVDEDETPTSDKLIKLDSVSVLKERRTRSGKSFDAIGLGKDTWV